MNWQSEIKGFVAYLQLEKALSTNTTESYQRDIQQFADFICEETYIAPKNIMASHCQSYLAQLYELGIAERSQARWISSIRQFFNYLILERICEDNPAQLIDMPKLPKKLPDTLSHQEVQDLITNIDVSEKNGHRNRAILELLYGCGLRVSELTSLQLSNIFREEEFIRIIGKGNKERFIPIHQKAIKEIELYEEGFRNHLNIKPKFEDILFLSQRGNQLSRVMIFNIVKKATEQAGIQKNVSPHTLRHSFATELVKNGANLRAVQEMLGHASIVTTEIYTHLNREHLKETILNHHPIHLNK